MYRWTKLFAAMADAFEVPQSARGGFEQRLRELFRYGVPPVQPSRRGGRRLYSRQDVGELCIAANLMLFRLTPGDAARIIINNRDHINSLLQRTDTDAFAVVVDPLWFFDPNCEYSVMAPYPWHNDEPGKVLLNLDPVRHSQLVIWPAPSFGRVMAALDADAE